MNIDLGATKEQAESLINRHHALERLLELHGKEVDKLASSAEGLVPSKSKVRVLVF